jgi:hypothetical protein
MRSRRIVTTKPRAVPRLALDSRLGQTTALGAPEPATRRAQSRPADMPRRTAVRHDLLRHAACTTRHATSDMPQAGARRSAAAHPAPRWFVCLCVCLLVCLFVCLFARRTSKKIGTKELIDWQCPTLALHCAYVSTPISTPSVPPRVQVPHAHLRYCGVLRGTHRDEDRREHRRPSRGREERVRRERAVEVALDRLDGLQNVSAACCNADRALQHRPWRPYHVECSECKSTELLSSARTVPSADRDANAHRCGSRSRPARA